jgi:hypothetical protein
MVTSGSCGSLGAPLALLSTPLRLHDVRDVEALAQSVLTRSGLELSYHDREDALSYLIEEAWRASTAYEPGAGATDLQHLLRRRAPAANGRLAAQALRPHDLEVPRPQVPTRTAGCRTSRRSTTRRSARAERRPWH